MKLGTAYVVIRGDYKGLPRDLDTAKQQVAKSVDRMQQKIKSITFRSAGVAAAAFSALFAYEIKKSIDRASDFKETVSKTDAVFTNQAKIIMAWSRDSARAMGLSQQAALDNASSLGNMFRQLGAGTDIAARNSMKMVQLSADLASFHNVSGGAAAVLEAMGSAFRGEYDALQKYIPTINAAAVQQQALATTGKTSAKELTALEKATAALEIILKDAGVATGDFKKTSGELANQQRIMAANAANLSVKLGEELLPIANDVVTTFNNWFTANDKLIGQKIHESIDKTKSAVQGIYYIYQELPDSMTGVGGAGLVGWLLFGSKLGKIVFATSVINDGLKSMRTMLGGNTKADLKVWNESISNIWEVIIGKRNAMTGALKDVSSEWGKILAVLPSLEGATLPLLETEKKLTDEIKIQGVSLEKLEELRKTVHGQDLDRIQEAIDDILRRVEAKEKADADMLASFIKMADDELVMWDALNAHALMSLDKQAAAAEAAYTKMAWGADAFGEHLFEVEKTATILTEAEIRKRLLAHGSFVDGVKIGFMDILDSQITWANVGLSVTSNMYSIMQSGLSDAFYTMATDMQDLEGVWEDFTGNILKMFSNMLAQMAVQWAASSIIRTLSGGSLELVGGTAPSIVSTGLQVAGIGSKVAGLFGGGSAAVGSTALLAGAGEVSTAGMMAGMGLGGAGGGGALAGGSAGLGPGLAAAGPYLALAAPVLLGMYLGSKRGRPMTEAERYQEQINRAVQGISDLTLSPSGTSVYGSDANQIFGNLGLDEKQRAEVGKRITINAPLINIEGSLVADENSLNELAEEMDMRLHRLAQLETGI